MKLFVWKRAVSYLAVAHAESVARARELLISDENDCIGESGDGSCPERDKAREDVRSYGPFIYSGEGAYFALTDSAECREHEANNEALEKQAKALRIELASTNAANEALCDTVELLRAENTRLKGLIEGMGHEASCESVRLRRKCNCVKSQVNA